MIGPNLGPSTALTTDKYEMCYSLLNQFNSVLPSQIMRKLFLKPSSFSTKQPSMEQSSEVYLTDIVLSEEIITGAIH